MDNPYNPYPCSYCQYAAMCSSKDMIRAYGTYPYYYNQPMYIPYFTRQFADENFTYNGELDYDSRLDISQSVSYNDPIILKDYGPQPYVVDIDKATKQNNNYRTTLWTGNHLQLTLMSIKVGGDIGVEVHPIIDQFIRIEEGQGIAQMGPSKNNLNFQRNVYDGFAIFVPAGTWHNVVNTGNKPLKLYSIYAPPQHPHGTIHATKEIAHVGSMNSER
ncbi:cupin domain-containing protein [Clostridium tagluense]|uniref:cupin domain-containing protein n=1 Tax=Clostridium tagluense TaxID=360422 RepID=UPI001C0E64E9|nr:cupin domain-containing protein [Clostridium tagluense]MBU3128808.1 cupin domain-containing protein [Clostridium tagluense]MCB2313058.1 cupin domain-containing protein [Clostridium tagluense]MCB2317833.1 cupin domain-containing protein [Clostridium tagluense]MCB2322618.1 cupin domain-containing protein [Clostridium tagluense]MCB2327607.1 cupin domain-containing protein [Clostridium tagluense]